ncbi:hypothetical protein U7230_01730 [Carboxydochorda subterranea]|uniref:Uncharacterized protein n=1 Tax=Carboxydichorda subterranea TaxID=3109565 RepID=A0ABZ1BY70_9FIRM|nr:hypothetical protein [Limnochorda sp. L945t]WRP17755.1 hypothetical protein U7230_01730 [Limnochorda sp. L945t]
MTARRQEKLEALRHVAMLMRPDGPLLVLFGFLAGRIDQVEFVRNLEGVAVAVQLSLDGRIWPRVPFRGRVQEEPILNPVAFVDLVALRDDEIYVRVDFPWGQEPEWYARVAQDSAVDRKERLAGAIERIRQRIDFALDVYRTAQPLIAGSSEEERRRLQFVVQTARDEIQALSRQLSELESELSRQQP